MLRHRQRAWNSLQLRCLTWMCDGRRSLLDLERAAGLPDGALRRWFGDRGHILSDRTLNALAQLLAVAFLTAVAESGGITNRDRLRRHGFAMIERNRWQGRLPRHQVARKIGDALRGRRQPGEAAARSFATRSASGAIERALQAAHAVSRAPEGRALRSLDVYLRWHPQPGRELRLQAELTAARLDECIGQVISWWNPALEKRGLPKLSGRPGEVDRCRRLREWIQQQGTPGGYGYWRLALEGKEWRRDHAAGCPTLKRAVQPRQDGAEISPPGQLAQRSA